MREIIAKRKRPDGGEMKETKVEEEDDEDPRIKEDLPFLRENLSSLSELNGRGIIVFKNGSELRLMSLSGSSWEYFRHNAIVAGRTTLLAAGFPRVLWPISTSPRAAASSVARPLPAAPASREGWRASTPTVGRSYSFPLLMPV